MSGATARPSTSAPPSSSDLHFTSFSHRSSMSDAADRRRLVLERITQAATLPRREPADIQLVAVSKGRSAGQIEELIAAGQRDFGENRVQEALCKWPELLARYPDIRLHEVGRGQ